MGSMQFEVRGEGNVASLYDMLWCYLLVSSQGLIGSRFVIYDNQR